MEINYILFWKSTDNGGIVKRYSNLRSLSEESDIPYWTLYSHFGRKGQVWHYYKDKDVYVLKSELKMVRGKNKSNFGWEKRNNS